MTLRRALVGACMLAAIMAGVLLTLDGIILIAGRGVAVVLVLALMAAAVWGLMRHE